jgi:Lrp/AsnC family transcriptional regulator, leucine-responsive regulatory protein
MLIDAPEVVEADRVTGEDCIMVRIIVTDVHQLQAVVDRFLPYSSTNRAIVQSTTVSRRLPKL